MARSPLNAIVLPPLLSASLHLVIGLGLVALIFALLRSLLSRLAARGTPWSGESPRLLLQTLARIAALLVVTLALEVLPLGSTGLRLLQALSQLVLVVLMRLVQPFFCNGVCGFVGIFRCSAPCCKYGI